jgi:hypothetical protein
MRMVSTIDSADSIGTKLVFPSEVFKRVEGDAPVEQGLEQG